VAADEAQVILIAALWAVVLVLLLMGD